MRSLAPEIVGLTAIFLVSMLGAWELDSLYGSWVFRLLLIVFGVTAIAAGRRNGWAEAALGGLLVGALAPAMFYSGVVLAELAAGEFGDIDAPLLVFLVVVYSIVFGIPFATAGGLLATLSHAVLARRRPLMHA
jgi:hypothetical protein